MQLANLLVAGRFRLALSTIAFLSSSVTSMPDSFSASVTIASVTRSRAGVLHPRPEHAGHERAADPAPANAPLNPPLVLLGVVIISPPEASRGGGRPARASTPSRTGGGGPSWSLAAARADGAGECG